MFQWYDTRVKKVKVPAAKFEPNISSLKGQSDIEVTAIVNDQSGDMVGSYLPNYNTGKLVFTFEPGGVYEFVIEAPGYQTIKEKIHIMGLGSYQKIINKKWLLIENGLEAPSK